MGKEATIAAIGHFEEQAHADMWDTGDMSGGHERDARTSRNTSSVFRMAGANEVLRQQVDVVRGQLVAQTRVATEAQVHIARKSTR